MVPYRYGGGSRLSSAYTMGRDGKPLPRYAAEKTSLAYRAWKVGRAEYLRTKKKGG